MDKQLFLPAKPHVPLQSLEFSLKDVSKCFREIRALPGAKTCDLALVKVLLYNGMTVGDFCLWYLLQECERRERGGPPL
jgi:hypothetical protein